MQHKQWMSVSKLIRLKHYILPLIALFLGLAAMNVVSPVATGLDPSWQITLSKAHSQGLVWGKDIIFTYGPYGYLFTGSLVDRNLFEMQFARYLLATLWIYFSLDFLIKNTNPGIRLVGLFSFLLLPFAPAFDNNQFTESFNISIHEVQFTLLILLLLLKLTPTQNLVEEQKISHYYKYYFYGVLSSFLLLIKFSFGFFAVICFLGTISCNAILGSDQQSSFQQRSLPVVCTILGFCFGLLTFFSPIGSAPFLALSVACLWGIVLTFALKLHPISKRITVFFSRQNIARFMPLVFSVLLLISVTAIHPTIRTFLIGSWQISKGYNQSMSLIGDHTEQVMGTVLLIGIVLLGVIAVFQDRKYLGITLSFVILAFITFKHAFIRYMFAYAAMYYAPTIPAFLTCFGVLIFQKPVKRKAFIRTIWLSFFAFAIFFFTEHYSVSPVDYAAFLSPNRLSARFALLIHPHSAETEILRQGKENLLSSTIQSQEILDRVSQEPIDVQPWEVSIVEANQLNWQPLPIFQAYSAYTRWLDRKNLESYIANPPNYIIYSFKAIDYRHPYFDQPQTNLYIFCNYARVELSKSASVVSLGSTGSTGKITLLQKRGFPLCDPSNPLPVDKSILATWNQIIDLEQIQAIDARSADEVSPANNDLLLVSIDLDYSLFGKVYNLAFKTPPVYLSVTYKNGRHENYRLVIDNAKSKLMLGKLPRSFKYAFRDFDHQDPASTVQSIALFSPHQKVFTEQTKFSFFKLPQLNDPSSGLTRS